MANLSQVCLKAGKLEIFPSCCPRKLVPDFFVDFRDNNFATVGWAIIFLAFCFQLVIAKFVKPALLATLASFSETGSAVRSALSSD